MDDVPHTFSKRHVRTMDNDDDGDDYDQLEDDNNAAVSSAPLESSYTEVSSASSDPKNFNAAAVLFEPSFLQWDASPASPPKPWRFVTPKACQNLTETSSSVFPLFSGYVFAGRTAEQLSIAKKICDVKRRSKSVANYVMLPSSASSTKLVTNVSSRMLVNNNNELNNLAR